MLKFRTHHLNLTELPSLRASGIWEPTKGQARRLDVKKKKKRPLDVKSGGSGWWVEFQGIHEYE